MRKHPGEGHGGAGGVRPATRGLDESFQCHGAMDQSFAFEERAGRWSSTMLYIATVAKSRGERGPFCFIYFLFVGFVFVLNVCIQFLPKTNNEQGYSLVFASYRHLITIPHHICACGKTAIKRMTGYVGIEQVVVQPNYTRIQPSDKETVMVGM